MKYRHLKYISTLEKYQHSENINQYLKNTDKKYRKLKNTDT